MATKLTDALVKALPAPAKGYRITFDKDVPGLGVRVTVAGARSWTLDYRTSAGRTRRMTLPGSAASWTVSQARDHARKLIRRIADGADPAGERQAERAAPTVADLAARFDAEHLPKRRPATQRDYRSILRLHILPELGRIKVADLRHADVERLHRAVKARYRANRSVAVLSKMLNLAVKWELAERNVASGIERKPEDKRERFLTPAELARLGEVLTTHPERTTCNAIRLLLLTGARKGEMLSARWEQIDLAAGAWTKPSASTKQGREHRVPLSKAALMLLAEMHAAADPARPWLFPGANPDAPLVEIKRTWLAVCVKSGLAKQVAKLVDGKPFKDRDGKPVMVWQSTVRLHDLRHSYASILASSGLSLPVIGALLGHTQAATTARYAHLLDDPLRAATERASAFIASAGKPTAEVVQIKRHG